MFLHATRAGTPSETTMIAAAIQIPSAAATTAAAQASSVASRLISALSSLETGQPAFALAASFSNVA